MRLWIVAMAASIALLPSGARAETTCGGFAPLDGTCTASVIPQCNTSECPVTVTLVAGRALTGVVTVTVDGVPSGFHAEQTCEVVLGFDLPACTATAHVTPFDLGVCSANVAGVARWSIACSTLP